MRIFKLGPNYFDQFTLKSISLPSKYDVIVGIFS